MRKKIAGPVLYSQWMELLNKPLTDETALCLRCGKLKEKELRVTLFNRISDYVVNAYNCRVEAVKTADFNEIVFALRRFSAELSRLYFFTELDFLADAHKEALMRSLQEATIELIGAISKKFNPQDADLTFELNRLRRQSGVGINEQLHTDN